MQNFLKFTITTLADEGDYASEDETEARPKKVEALGEPVTRVMRQDHGGVNHVKQGMTN